MSGRHKILIMISNVNNEWRQHSNNKLIAKSKNCKWIFFFKEYNILLIYYKYLYITKKIKNKQKEGRKIFMNTEISIWPQQNTWHYAVFSYPFFFSPNDELGFLTSFENIYCSIIKLWFTILKRDSLTQGCFPPPKTNNLSLAQAYWGSERGWGWS